MPLRRSSSSLSGAKINRRKMCHTKARDKTVSSRNSKKMKAEKRRQMISQFAVIIREKGGGDSGGKVKRGKVMCT